MRCEGWTDVDVGLVSGTPRASQGLRMRFHNRFGARLANTGGGGSMASWITGWATLWMALAILAPLQASSAFTYQGRLAVSNRPANGTYDFSVQLFPAISGGSAIGSTATALGVGVTNGLFNLSLDFGASAFNGDPRWLEISVRTNGASSHTLLTPRRPITATPQSLFARSAASAQSVPASGVSGTLATNNLPPLTVDGSGLLNLNASQILSGTVPDARLAPSVARIPDVLTSSNFLSDRVYATQADLQAQVNALSNRVAQITAALPPQSALVAPALPGGLVIASPIAGDLALTSQGLVQFAGFDAPSWTTGSSVGAPSARHSHESAWTGTRMFVWGGVSGGTRTATGGAYEPGNNNWTSISEQDAPAARRGHTLAWTGERLLVWGGKDADALGTGGIYDPTNRSWSPITLSGAPSAREGQAGAWTGARLVIFGGVDFNVGLFNDGASFDPLGNLWDPLPTAGAPSARYLATATWCGDRVVVFGGANELGELDTGAALPMTGGVTHGAWSALPTLDAPSPRQGHSAVWTGSRLIVWGGKSGGGALGTGASYDPMGNTWTTLPTTLAPSPRWGHVAFWTGREMLVFGGEDAGGALSTGAAYDPGANRWRYVSGTGTPTARKNFAAAWTGNELVVFGGQSAGSPVTTLGTVQRLVPEAAWYLYRKP